MREIETRQRIKPLGFPAGRQASHEESEKDSSRREPGASEKTAPRNG
jgi:hypothetical protein